MVLFLGKDIISDVGYGFLLSYVYLVVIYDAVIILHTLEVKTESLNNLRLNKLQV